MKQGKRGVKNTNSRGPFLKNLIIVVIIMLFIVMAYKIAPDYIRKTSKSEYNLIINNNNVTLTDSMKNAIVFGDKDVIYLSKQDIQNFFDKYIYYDEKYDQIITTSDTKVATLEYNKNEMTVNGSTETILGGMMKKGDITYLPFSEMGEVYNVEIKYIPQTKTITVDSMDRELFKADCNKNTNVKLFPKTLSGTVQKIKKGENVIWISSKDGWTKIRTEDGKIGYVKDNALSNKITIRENMEEEKKQEEKISLFWDYYKRAGNAPDRTGESYEGINVVSPTFFALQEKGKGNIIDKAGDSGKKYIQWAKSNQYEVWALVSNESMIDTTREIMQDYKLREKTINGIVTAAVQYKLDGINLDFENMYEEDKDLYTQFVVELYPRLKDIGVTLSVDVTAPDGGSTWSMCFDRYALSENCDYLVFMAYDQYGISSKEPGTTAGFDWVKVSLNKFLRDIPGEKIILGVPFYTREWKTQNGESTSLTVSMKKQEEVIPDNVEKKWDDDLKQYYVDYNENGIRYQMWMEEENSIKAKLELVKQNNLAGAAYWKKDDEKQEIWGIIKQELGL